MSSGSVDRRMFADSCTSLLRSTMLVEAEKSGYFRSSEGVELLKTDKGLDPVRSREDFRQLLARVLAASAPREK